MIAQTGYDPKQDIQKSHSSQIIRIVVIIIVKTCKGTGIEPFDRTVIQGGKVIFRYNDKLMGKIHLNAEKQHQKKRKDIAAVSFPDRGKMLQKFKKSDINDNNDK